MKNGQEEYNTKACFVQATRVFTGIICLMCIYVLPWVFIIMTIGALLK